MKKKIIKSSIEFKLMTYIFEVNDLTQCRTLLVRNFGKEEIHKIILCCDFIVYLHTKYVTTWRCHILPQTLCNSLCISLFC